MLDRGVRLLSCSDSVPSSWRQPLCSLSPCITGFGIRAVSFPELMQWRRSRSEIWGGFRQEVAFEQGLKASLRVRYESRLPSTPTPGAGWGGLGQEVDGQKDARQRALGFIDRVRVLPTLAKDVEPLSATAPTLPKFPFLCPCHHHYPALNLKSHRNLTNLNKGQTGTHQFQ